MKNNYQELCDYFTAMPTSIPAIKMVIVGEDEAIDLQSNTIKYPLLWVETPDIQYVGTDEDPRVRFQYAIVIIKNEPRKTAAESNKALSDMELLLRSIYNRILQDAVAGEFDLVLRSDAGSPILRWSGDNCYGWRLELLIEITRPLC